jgi:Ca-activated chloride channel homolog
MSDSLAVRCRNRSPRQGSVLVLAAAIILMFALIGSYVINMAYVELSTTQLQVASDAVTRAAGRTFIVTGSKEKAITAARDIGKLNLVAREPLQIEDEDIVFGESVRKDFSSRYSFTPSTKSNAVQVTARRSAATGDAVKLLLPGFLSVNAVAMEKTAISTQVDVDVALVVDRSGSMAYAADEKAAYPPLPKSSPPNWNFGQAVPPNSRWGDLEAAVSTFAKELDNSPIDIRLAVVSYSDGGKIEQSLSSNLLGSPASLAKYSKKFDSGATNIAAGLNAGGNALKSGAAGSRTGAIKVIVLMTDGIRTAGALPVPVAEKLAKSGAIIFTVTFSKEADKKTMQSIAEKGNGKSFHATNATSLEEAFVEIVKQLPTLITL